MKAERSFPLIDSDGHVLETADHLADYFEGPFRGKKMYFQPFPSLDGFDPSRQKLALKTGRRELLDPGPEGWLAFLDEVGLDCTVLYPTAGLAVGLIRDSEWACIVSRAYNNWLADRYLRAGPKFKGIALLPLQEPREAAVELRRAVSELGMVGGLLPAMGLKQPLGDERFHPIYQEAETLNCMLAVHGAPAQGLGFALDLLFDNFPAAMTLTHPMSLMIQMTSMVFSGIFERFPNLRVGFFEAGVGWAIYMLDRLERQHRVVVRGKSVADYLTSGNVYLSCEGDERTLPLAKQVFGANSLLFASDFPHEPTVEDIKEELGKFLRREDLSAEDKQNIFYNNPRRLYGLI
jgi:predicted TIM-barrel fold metal-dependent hydrolase